jgi:cytochrome c biogenesis protein ResB
MILKFFYSLKNPRKFGAFAMHLGAIIILTGGIITALYRKSGYISFSKGETRRFFERSNLKSPIKSLGFSVRLDNFTLKNFKSTISIIENDGHIIKGNLRINHPFKYKDYVFYQAAFNPSQPDWTVLDVVKDPGVEIVYIGFFLLDIGAILTAIFAMRKEN